MKTSFIDINKPFGLCMYLCILVIMIVVMDECKKSKGLVPNNAKSQATTAYKIKTQKMFQNN